MSSRHHLHQGKGTVFVDGCFWHRCPQHATDPATRGAWWQQKLEGNVARDRETDEHLRWLGWTVVRFWEHEDMAQAAKVVAKYLSDSGRGARDARQPTGEK